MNNEQGTKIGKPLTATCYLLPVICYLFFVTCYLFSCKSVPSLPEVEVADGSVLPLAPGAVAYVFADVQDAMPILNQTNFSAMKTPQLQQMLDRTASVMAAVYQPPNERSYQLVARGNYPASGAELALGFSKDWKKQRSVATGASYWYSEKDRLSIALNQRQARVTASTENTSSDPYTSGSGTIVPSGFTAFSGGSVLSCWLDEPGPLIDQKLQQMGVPIQIPAEMLFISIMSGGEDTYTAHVRIQVESAIQARALASMLTIARAFLPRSDSFAVLQSLLFANPPVLNDRNLDITSAVLSSGEIALLFNTFSL